MLLFYIAQQGAVTKVLQAPLTDAHIKVASSNIRC